MGISKLTYILKEVALLEWLQDEDALPWVVVEGFGQSYPSSHSSFA